MKEQIAKGIATSFGLGYMPIAPGTFGALFGMLSYWVIMQFWPQEINIILGVLIVIFTLIGTWCCKVLEQIWGHDPGKIVMDETVGQWITYLFIPFNPLYMVLGFILFRFFDILKPLGIRQIDEGYDHPFSVMLDDIIAGVYAWIVLQAIIYFL